MGRIRDTSRGHFRLTGRRAETSRRIIFISAPQVQIRAAFAILRIPRMRYVLPTESLQSIYSRTVQFTVHYQDFSSQSTRLKLYPSIFPIHCTERKHNGSHQARNRPLRYPSHHVSRSFKIHRTSYSHFTETSSAKTENATPCVEVLEITTKTPPTTLFPAKNHQDIHKHILHPRNTNLRVLNIEMRSSCTVRRQRGLLAIISKSRCAKLRRTMRRIVSQRLSQLRMSVLIVGGICKRRWRRINCEMEDSEELSCRAV